MDDNSFRDLCNYARHFSRLDDTKIELLHDVYDDVIPIIPDVTNAFYDHLLSIPKVVPFLENRLDSLKQTHQNWVEEIFTSNFDVEYTRKIYHVGNVHVIIKLPVEFMAGAITIIQSELLKAFKVLYADDKAKLVAVTDATNSATGFSLLVMQESFQSSTLVKELEKFLQITGMSRKLFDNLARAYN